MKAKLIGHFLHGAIKKVKTEDGKQYFIDDRAKSKTKGKVFNMHPDLKSAKIVDILITEIH